MYRPLLYTVTLSNEGRTASESELRSLGFDQALWYECQRERIVFFAKVRSWRSLMFKRTVALGSFSVEGTLVGTVFCSGASLKVRLCGFKEPAVSGLDQTLLNISVWVSDQDISKVLHCI